MMLPLGILSSILLLIHLSAGTAPPLAGRNPNCPRDCYCDEYHKIATCRSFDGSVQDFNEHFTTLIVETGDPLATIELPFHVFKKAGLQNVEKIRIVNATITKLHSTAFAGLGNLFSLDLRSTGLTYIYPDMFITNTRLRTVNLSDNPIYHKYPYILNSGTIEELVICNAKITHLNESSFANLPAVHYIGLSNNQIVDIDVKSFSKLVVLEQLDLSNNLIEDIPNLLFVSNPDLTVLKLSNNSLKTANGINTESLETLDVSYNQIREITERMFDEMPNLINLKISFNGLEVLHPNSLKELVELNELDLSNNLLVNIPYQIFANNPELTAINLSHNLIKNMPDKGFLFNQKPGVINHFDASYNQIEFLHENSFATMVGLTHLYLNNNKIKALPSLVFSQLKSLQLLDLSFNEIETFNSNLFELNRNLHHLNFRNNPMISIPEESFTSLVNLISLDLSHCQLTELKWNIPELTLNRLQSLQNLNLSSNQLTQITADFLSMTPNLRNLDLENNPLKCDLELDGMMQWLKSHNVEPGNYNPTHLPNAQWLIIHEQINIQKQKWIQFKDLVCKQADLAEQAAEEEEDEEDEDEDDEYDYDQSTIPPESEEDDDDDSDDEGRIEVDLEDPAEVQLSIMRYANYTNIIMFLIGALSSSTLVLLMAWMCKQYRNGKLVRSSNLLLNQAFIDNLSTQQRTKKDCGLVYKQLSEETKPVRSPMLARLYEPYLQSLNPPNNVAVNPTYQQVSKDVPPGDMV